MQLKKNSTDLQDFDKAVSHEWIETNGLGGWAGSTLIGCNTRRYHGLLVAAIEPPALRMVMLSKLDETIIVNNQRFELGTNEYRNAIYPKGNQYFHAFAKDLFPEWIYQVNGIQLKKTVAMVHDDNATLVIYEVLEADAGFTMELLPLLAARGYHGLQHAYNNIYWDVQFADGIFHNQPYAGSPEFFISIPGASYHHDPKWFYAFNYRLEKYRGLDFEEDLFNHGVFSVALKKGDVLGIIIADHNPKGRDAFQLFDAEKQRKEALINGLHHDLLQQLSLAADQFIVKRAVPLDPTSAGDDRMLDLKTVIAGYHWFTDWSRDSMISLPGLCLSTGRHEDAKKIIGTFAKYTSMGMLPNRFPDNNEPPEYNNVDGTLWFFVAIYKYVQATGDQEFVLGEILPVLKNIIDWHFKGTRYHIHVDEDGLLYAGENGQPLTWMDARIGDRAVTARMGKPVEIQALWYNALLIFSGFLLLNGEQEDAKKMEMEAAKTRASFRRIFWNSKGNYLCDLIDENNQPDGTVRPNQLFAISLPFELTEPDEADAVLEIIEKKLYTPVGLRSLSPDDGRYTGIYGGDANKRDAAYHQGTVWTWLLGPYIDAIMKSQGAGARLKAMQIIETFVDHLQEGCISSIAEIADGDPPHHLRGCVAQAWSVAEILRVVHEYELFMD